MKQVIQDYTRCTGCAACSAVCNFGAIKMEENDRGFRIPIIDDERCRDCGACTRVCPQQKKEEYSEYNEDYAIIAQIQDKEVLGRSQSGGISYAVSQAVLGEHGIVYGAVLENNAKVRHVRIDMLQGLRAMQGSKYIQSDVSGIYSEISKDLRAGTPVLFTGTPCQCDGLRQYMRVRRIDTERLFLVDLICHGVPSPKLWRDYVAFIERKYGMPVRKAIFRDKSFGWATHYETFEFEQHKVSKEDFRNIFYTNVCLRQSCYTCRYSSMNRVGDITVGDAWSIDRSKQYRADSGGLSLVLLNTQKGQELFERFSDKIDYEKREMVQFMQPNLQHSTETIENVDAFWRDYRRYGFGFIHFIYGSKGFVNRAVRKIRRILLRKS